MLSRVEFPFAASGGAARGMNERMQMGKSHLYMAEDTSLSTIQFFLCMLLALTLGETLT